MHARRITEMAIKRPFQFSLSKLLLAVTAAAVCLAIPQLAALIVAAAMCFAIVFAPILLIRGLSEDDREEQGP